MPFGNGNGFLFRSSSGAGVAPRDGYEYDVYGRFLPVAKDLNVYIQGDTTWGDGGLYAYSSTHGNDSSDGLTPTTPLRSLKGFRRAFGGPVTDGYRLIVHLMGAGGEPVDTPTEGRVYWARNLPISFGGSGESWRTSIIYRGPRSYLPQGLARGLSSATNVANGSFPAGRTKLTFNGSMTAATYHIRWTHNDGREVIAPFPVSEDVSGDSSSVYTEILSKESFDYIKGLGSRNNWQSVIPAVLIQSDAGDTQFHGLMVYGEASFRVGDRTSANAPEFDANPYPLFERINFSRPTFAWKGSGWVDGCRAADHAFVAPGCAPRFRNMVVEGFLQYEGDASYRTASSQYTSTLDASCRMLAYDTATALDTQRYTGTSDPDDAVTGTDLCLTGQGARLNVGRDVFGNGGRLRLFKGMSINCKQGGAVAATICGKSAALWVPNEGRVCIVPFDSAGIGIWAKNGGQVRLNDNLGDTYTVYAGTRVYTTTHHLKVESGADISLGTAAGAFRDASTWNGRFSRSLENTGGYPTAEGDASIHDQSKETSGWWDGE